MKPESSQTMIDSAQMITPVLATGLTNTSVYIPNRRRNMVFDASTLDTNNRFVARMCYYLVNNYIANHTGKIGSIIENRRFSAFDAEQHPMKMIYKEEAEV